MISNNPKNRQQWILELLNSEGLSYNDTLAKFRQMWAKSKTTFDSDWNKANEKYIDHQDEINKAKEQASINEEVERLKKGIKTKHHRLDFYQTQIELMQKQLTGEIVTYFLIGNKPAVNPNKGEYILPLEKQNEIRKAIKEYQTEISKIEGDYAATQQEIKQTNITPPKADIEII